MKGDKTKQKPNRDFFVGIVLLDNLDRIYLIKEEDKNKIGKDRWNLPGGSIDGDEGLVEAALRETREETGYGCKIDSLLGCCLCKKEDRNWIYVVFGAMLDKKAGKRTDPGIKTGKWFEKDEFLHLDSDKVVHPDMQLVYKIATEGGGLPLESVKFIDYDIQ
jgi:ADP-ribose pyrophosphatase YjhB (NUDIX family)